MLRRNIPEIDQRKMMNLIMWWFSYCSFWILNIHENTDQTTQRVALWIAAQDEEQYIQLARY